MKPLQDHIYIYVLTCTRDMAAFLQAVSLSLRPKDAIVALWLGERARTSTWVARRSRAAALTSLLMSLTLATMAGRVCLHALSVMCVYVCVYEIEGGIVSVLWWGVGYIYIYTPIHTLTWYCLQRPPSLPRPYPCPWGGWTPLGGWYTMCKYVCVYVYICVCIYISQKVGCC